jgi:hypothetical protein
MKNNMIKYIVVVMGVLCAGACEDYLDKEPDDFLTMESVFDDKSNVESWLSACYSGIRENYFDFAHSFDAFADDIAPALGWTAYGWQDAIGYQRGSFDPTTGWRFKDTYWFMAPRRVRSAYILIDNIKPLPEQGLTEQEVVNMKAEAKFLIAYNNYVRLMTFGAIPLQEGIVDLEAEDMMVGQTPFDVAVEKIEQHLLEAAEILPPYYTDAKNYGRATSIMCHAVRARMLLFAASPLVNGNTDYANYTNDKGEAIFNQTPQPAKWAKTAAAYKTLIDLAEAYGHELYKQYNADGSIDPFLSYQNMMFTRYDAGNKEILFARAWTNQDSYDTHAQPRGTAGNGGLGVTQTLVDAFFMKNGLPPVTGYNADGSPIINSASGYTETGFSGAEIKAKTRWTEGAPGASALNAENIITRTGTYNMYCNREPRFYISVLYNEAWFRRENRNTQFYSGGYDGGPTHDAPSFGYLVRKKVHPDVDPRNGVHPFRPGIIARLGEAYLGYVEALNESDPGNPDILEYLNRIRERAGIPLYGNGSGEITVPADQDDMREAIHRERRVELNCENGIRWEDLRRWKKAEEALNGVFYGMNFNGTAKSDNANSATSYFVRSYVMDRVFTKRQYWMPVPQTEIDKNLKLRQLPGW